MVNNMQITFYTILWALLALCSVTGIYFFNKKRTFMTFLTSRKYLLLFIVASLFGMRQSYWVAFIFMGIALFLMCLDYKPYIETCRRLKKFQENK